MSDPNDEEGRPAHEGSDADETGQGSHTSEPNDLSTDTGKPKYVWYQPDSAKPVSPAVPPWLQEVNTNWERVVSLLPASREPDDISPPGKIARTINHLSFYVVVMSLVPALLWYAYSQVPAGNRFVFFWPAIVGTSLSVLVVVLRIFRGSIMQARRDLGKNSAMTRKTALTRAIGWRNEYSATKAAPRR